MPNNKPISTFCMDRSAMALRPRLSRSDYRAWYELAGWNYWTNGVNDWITKWKEYPTTDSKVFTMQLSLYELLGYE